MFASPQGSQSNRRPVQSAINTGVCVVCLVVVCFLLTGCPGGGNGASGGADTTTGDIGDDAAQNSSLPGRAIVDHDDWTRIEPTEDPFSMPSDSIDCQKPSHKLERVNGLRALGIVTTNCNYLTVGQGAQLGADAGQYLHVRAYHFGLTAPDGQTARMALSIGGNTVWNVETQIPADSCLLADDIEVMSSTSFDPGAPVRFHVRNHGNNEYYLIDVRLTDEPVGVSPPPCE